MKKIKILLFSLVVSALINNISYGMDNEKIKSNELKKEYTVENQNIKYDKEKEGKEKKVEITPEYLPPLNSFIEKKRNYEDVKKKNDDFNAEKNSVFDIDFDIGGNDGLEGKDDILCELKEKQDGKKNVPTMMPEYLDPSNLLIGKKREYKNNEDSEYKQNKKVKPKDLNINTKLEKSKDIDDIKLNEDLLEKIENDKLDGSNEKDNIVQKNKKHIIGKIGSFRNGIRETIKFLSTESGFFNSIWKFLKEKYGDIFYKIGVVRNDAFCSESFLALCGYFSSINFENNLLDKKQIFESLEGKNFNSLDDVKFYIRELFLNFLNKTLSSGLEKTSLPDYIDISRPYDFEPFNIIKIKAEELADIKIINDRKILIPIKKYLNNLKFEINKYKIDDVSYNRPFDLIVDFKNDVEKDKEIEKKIKKSLEKDVHKYSSDLMMVELLSNVKKDFISRISNRNIIDLTLNFCKESICRIKIKDLFSSDSNDLFLSDILNKSSIFNIRVNRVSDKVGDIVLALNDLLKRYISSINALLPSIISVKDNFEFFRENIIKNGNFIYDKTKNIFYVKGGIFSENEKKDMKTEYRKICEEIAKSEMNSRICYDENLKKSLDVYAEELNSLIGCNEENKLDLNYFLFLIKQFCGWYVQNGMRCLDIDKNIGINLGKEFLNNKA